MKNIFIFLLVIGMVAGAYFNAQSKINQPKNLTEVRLGMSVDELKLAYGVPTAQERNQLIYIFDDASEMVVTIQDETVSSAKVSFHQPVKITDPEMKKLTLVQMESESLMSGEPSWFFAGKPEEGLIYKITSAGVIESITWVPPFSYTVHRPKQLQALLRDFQSKHLSNL